jgi:hypothetical protein
VDSESKIVEEKFLTTFDSRERTLDPRTGIAESGDRGSILQGTNVSVDLGFRAQTKESAASEFVPGPIAERR